MRKRQPILDKDNARSDVAHGKYLFRKMSKWECTDGRKWARARKKKRKSRYEYMRYLVTNQDRLLEWNHSIFEQMDFNVLLTVCSCLPFVPIFRSFDLRINFCSFSLILDGSFAEIAIFNHSPISFFGKTPSNNAEQNSTRVNFSWNWQMYGPFKRKWLIFSF